MRRILNGIAASAVLAVAVPVLAIPVDSGGGSGSGSGGTNACTSTQTTTCLVNEGGVAQFKNGRCVCQVVQYTPRSISNAERGDVGLVPSNDGKGEEIVASVMRALGQHHRHTVIYLGPDEIRHATSYSLGTDDIRITLGGLRVKPSRLANATPGIVTQSVEAAMANGWNRLGDYGLVLKPRGATRITTFKSMKGNTATTVHDFAGAATQAESAVGYYRVSDYSSTAGMNYAYSSDPDDGTELRGTQCAGFVRYAFNRAGFPISTYVYPQDLRYSVATALYAKTRDTVASGMSSLVSIFPDAPERIANQAVNCFAGKGCDDTGTTWQDEPLYSAATVSPDNLLPTSFNVAGGGTYAGWVSGVKSFSKTIAQTIDNAYGAATTPFERVELQDVTGGTYSTVTLTTW